jgi:hypothetical protein
MARGAGRNSGRGHVRGGSEFVEPAFDPAIAARRDRGSHVDGLRRAAGAACLHHLARRADTGEILGERRGSRTAVHRIAYLLYYRIMGRIGAPRTANVTYLIPLFGVLWAWLLLDEPLSMRVAIAGALILGGVALGQRQ